MTAGPPPLVPVEALPRRDLAALRVCGWMVYPTRTRGWRCTGPFGHQGPHELWIGPRLMARATGYRARPE